MLTSTAFTFRTYFIDKVKQGFISAPTLFSINVAVTLSYAFQDIDIDDYIRFKTSGKISDLTRYKAKQNTFQNLFGESSYTAEDTPALMDLSFKSCPTFDLLSVRRWIS